MPELPEVETTRRGIAPWCLRQTIEAATIWQPRLRWEVPDHLHGLLPGRCIDALTRRGKYLLLNLGDHSLIIHLGMSGSLRLSAPEEPRRKHDHWEFRLSNGKCLRYHDPRRFGALLLTPTRDLQTHPLLRTLGVEPLTGEFDGRFLHQRSSERSSPVKNFLMDSHLVVGVGNIYASESLFLAGIHPARAAGRVSRQRYEALAAAVKEVLGAAIASGGTTLRDYVNGSGAPGYFAQQLRVYGRAGEPCPECGTKVKCVRLGQRSSFFCPRCQT